MESYFKSQDLWNIIQGTTDQEEDKKNDVLALHIIQVSCKPNILDEIRVITSAKEAWKKLADLYKRITIIESCDEILKEIGWDDCWLSDKSRYGDLCDAIDKGVWKDVKKFLDHNPNALTAKIAPRGATVLHRAVGRGHINIVKNLVKFLSAKDLCLQDNLGGTALHNAAVVGSTEMAEIMVAKNICLVNIQNNYRDVPVILSASCGHQKMTRYLYKHTPFKLILSQDRRSLLFDCISSEIFDVALDLLQRCPDLVVSDTKNLSPLVALSRTPSAFPSGSQLVFWQKLIYLFPAIKHIYEEKVKHMQAKDVLRCISGKISKLNVSQFENFGVRKAIFEAVEQGIEEVIEEVIKSHPYILLCEDDKGRNVLSRGIVERREKFLDTVIKRSVVNVFPTTYQDTNKNNMLHQAAILPSSSRLGQISGAALQMQRELQWFQEVKKILRPRLGVELNCDGKTPSALFTEEHKNLVKEGERWTKGTATSSSVVAALIVTIMFAVAFTVPGGYDEVTGLPRYLNYKSFAVFIISDALSLFSSTASVLVFLGILTSRYREEDFLKSLPTKLILGLGTLLISIATMMICFGTTLVILLHERWPRISTPIILVGSIPVILYVRLQFPLLVEIFISTYGPSILNPGKVGKFIKYWWLV